MMSRFLGYESFERTVMAVVEAISEGEDAKGLTEQERYCFEQLYPIARKGAREYQGRASNFKYNNPQKKKIKIISRLKQGSIY